MTSPTLQSPTLLFRRAHGGSERRATTTDGSDSRTADVIGASSSSSPGRLPQYVGSASGGIMQAAQGNTRLHRPGTRAPLYLCRCCWPHARRLSAIHAQPCRECFSARKGGGKAGGLPPFCARVPDARCASKPHSRDTNPPSRHPRALKRGRDNENSTKQDVDGR